MADSTIGWTVDAPARELPGSIQRHQQHPLYFEWYWLLHEFQNTVRALPEARLAQDLFDWAAQHGLDPTHGGIFDQLDRRGRPVRTTKRLWPLAEAIKAHAVYTGTRAAATLATLVDFLLSHYQDPSGMLVEQLNREGQAMITELYGSSPYHLLFAYAESIKALQRTSNLPGGAANVARNAAALGSHVVRAGVLGEDESAAELRNGCLHG